MLLARVLFIGDRFARRPWWGPGGMGGCWAQCWCLCSQAASACVGDGTCERIERWPAVSFMLWGWWLAGVGAAKRGAGTRMGGGVDAGAASVAADASRGGVADGTPTCVRRRPRNCTGGACWWHGRVLCAVAARVQQAASACVGDGACVERWPAVSCLLCGWGLAVMGEAGCVRVRACVPLKRGSGQRLGGDGG